MAYLIDTSVLVRLTNATDSQHPVAVQAVMDLHRHGEILHIAPQVLIEFRSVATRPTAANGLGLSAEEAAAQAIGFEAAFPLLMESPDIYPAWRAVVDKLSIIGKQVHDARLIAVCQSHGVSHLLTFNVSHFTRMTGLQPSILVVDPKSF